MTSFRFPGKELVRMGDRMVRRVWEVERVDPAGHLPSIRARVEVRDGVPELREFSLTSTETGAQVEPSVLRNFDFEGMIEVAGGMAWAADAVWDDGRPDPSVVTVDDVLASARQGRKFARTARRTKITPAKLREVADVYRAAQTAPVRAVAEHFGKQRRMATLYVQRARAEGYLSEVD